MATDVQPNCTMRAGGVTHLVRGQISREEYPRTYRYASTKDSGALSAVWTRTSSLLLVLEHRLGGVRYIARAMTARSQTTRSPARCLAVSLSHCLTVCRLYHPAGLTSRLPLAPASLQYRRGVVVGERAIHYFRWTEFWRHSTHHRGGRS